MAHQLRFRPRQLLAERLGPVEPVEARPARRKRRRRRYHGYTDNVGDPNGNLKLSEERAFAVERWMEKVAPVNFPKGRIRIFEHGSQNPVAPNSTPQGRAENRRVEIVIGATAR